MKPTKSLFIPFDESSSSWHVLFQSARLYCQFLKQYIGIVFIFMAIDAGISYFLISSQLSEQSWLKYLLIVLWILVDIYITMGLYFSGHRDVPIRMCHKHLRHVWWPAMILIGVRYGLTSVGALCMVLPGMYILFMTTFSLPMLLIKTTYERKGSFKDAWYGLINGYRCIKGCRWRTFKTVYLYPITIVFLIATIVQIGYGISTGKMLSVSQIKISPDMAIIIMFATRWLMVPFFNACELMSMHYAMMINKIKISQPSS